MESGCGKEEPSFFLNFYLEFSLPLSGSVFMYLPAYMRVHSRVCICGGQGTTVGSQLFPSILVSRDQMRS